MVYIYLYLAVIIGFLYIFSVFYNLNTLGNISVLFILIINTISFYLFQYIYRKEKYSNIIGSLGSLSLSLIILLFLLHG